VGFSVGISITTAPVGWAEPVGCTVLVGVGTGVTLLSLPVGVGVGVTVGVLSTTPSYSITGACSLLLVIFTAALSTELTTEPSEPLSSVRFVFTLVSTSTGILAVILLSCALLITSISAFLLPVISRLVFLAIVSFVSALDPAFIVSLADLSVNFLTLPLTVIVFPLATSVYVPADLSSMLLNTALLVIFALGAFTISVLLAAVSSAGIVTFTAFLVVNTIFAAFFSFTAESSPFLVLTSTFFSFALTGTVPSIIVSTRITVNNLRTLDLISSNSHLYQLNLSQAVLQHFLILPGYTPDSCLTAFLS
jgi:hypothetical protein